MSLFKYFQRGFSFTGIGHQKEGGHGKGKLREKRKRLFQPNWLKEGDWLQFIEEENVMVCRACRLNPRISDPSSVMVKGCSNFRIDAIKKHDKSKKHIVAVASEKAKANLTETAMFKVIKKMDSKQIARMRILFRTAYFVAKEGLSFSKFPQLCSLQACNGLDLGSTYINDNGAATFIKAIGQHMNTEIQSEVENSEYFSVMSDGSTDVAHLEQELIYIRYLDGNATVRNKFVSIVELDDATAVGIQKGIHSGLSEIGQETKEIRAAKMVSVCFDGASVMMGAKGGVATLEKKDVPRLVEIHCVAHRLELAVLDALKSNSYLKEVEDIIEEVYKLYHYSPKKRRELKELSTVMDEALSQYGSISTIRWLASRSRAAETLLKNFPATITHMEQMVEIGKATEKPKCKGLLKKMKTVKFVKYLHFVLDFTKQLSILSQQFQKEHSLIIDVMEELETATLHLTEFKLASGPKVCEFENTYDEEHKTYRGITLSDTQQPHRNEPLAEAVPTSSEFCKIIDDTLECIGKRFENFSRTTPLSILKHSTYASGRLPLKSSNFLHTGEQTLWNWYIFMDCLLAKLMEADNVYRQWLKLKTRISHLRGGNMRRIYEDVAKCSDLGVISQLVKILLVIPSNTALCERGFSACNHLKTKLRNPLMNESLNALLRIVLNGPAMVDFEPEPSLEHWLNSGKGMRHLEHRSHGTIEEGSSSESDRD
ncbi:hypothetical protein HOLleu_09403 [Holothuria leucospilota]|uniref:TTF-type domain-containing protein n=1 Tax=Holothuria leucospilota TaxID=206669 RepID=A0A9Q1CDA5_HOLLE|nr:hypothetical protein HOLleu_09403 [Holothuria leucospilota]